MLQNFPPRVCYGAEIGGWSSGGTEGSRKEEVEGGKHMREFPSPVGHNQQSLAPPFRWVNWHLTGGETEAQRNSDMSQ